MPTEQAQPFELVTEPHDRGELTVIAFTAEEEMNGAFRVRAELSCAADADLLSDLEGVLLGKHAALDLHEGNRRLHGVVTALRAAGYDERRARVHLEIAPRLALLALRRQSRIFQDKTVRDIVGAILDEWRIPHAFQLSGDHRPRAYCTQHGESDYDFVRRILALEGIGFYFLPSPIGASLKEAPEIVFFDNPGAYARIPDPHVTRARGPSALRCASLTFERRHDDVDNFTLHRELAPRAALLGDFDFRRPQIGLFASSHADAFQGVPPSGVETGEPLDAFFYADRPEYEGSATGPEIDDARAQMTLEQLRREAAVGRGEIRSARVIPGHFFTLEGHTIDALNQDYVITRVEHRGSAPDSFGGGSPGYSYEVRFACVPGGVTYRPPVERGIRTVYGAETATVVGPEGESVYTDGYGRVKVRFHWDREGKGDEHSSCWLRVAEAWAGQRWGTQFIPRVGMEVLVTFLGGDVDRPLVTGCLYNTTHPTPFRVPGDRFRSGVRTQSSDGSGYNELSFQDRAGEEQILVQAERDLDLVVGRDCSFEIDRDETHKVAGSRTSTIEGSDTSVVAGAHTLTVAGPSVQTVKGDLTTTVQGAHTASVSGPADVRVGDDLTLHVDGDLRPEFGGRAELSFTDDAVVRAKGHLVAVVGQHDARRSATLHVEGGSELYATGATEIIADKALTLRVGKSSIRITPDAIELGADSVIVRAGTGFYVQADEKIRMVSKKEALFKAEKKLFLQAEAGSVQLTRDARVDGDTVKLNCSPDPVDDKMPEKKPVKPTTFSLVDDDGKPIGGQRIVLVMADGSERSAVLDQDGKVELDLEDSGTVVFPDLTKPQPA